MAIRSPLSLISSFPFSSKSHSSLSQPSQFSTLLFQPKTLTTQSLNLRFRNDAVASAFTDIEVGEDLPLEYGDWLPKPDPKLRRRAGILLHPTSFRGPYGIGDLGEEAFRFIDWLHLAGCSVWQVLPLVPPDEGGSPYAGQDANCGNTLLISLEELVKDGLLTNEELPQPIDSDRVNYSIVANLKDSLINKAAERLLLSDGEIKNQLEAFRRDPIISSWLEDSAYFAAIDDSLKAFSWYDWPEPLKNRHLAALENIYQEKKDFIDLFIAKQFLFQRQWQKLRNYAQMKGVSIMGDMPIYNRHGYPMLVSGVPPDAFSDTGQLWGSPLYDWKAMEKDGFSWWIRRIRRAQNLYGEFRIDHFRGFAGFWAVPSEAKVAMVGRWKVGPRKSLFDAISRTVGKIDIIAEDLGVITEDVTELRKYIGAPGMAVLQFGFGSDSSNPHLPHNHELNQVVYTGTHDNDTVFRYLHITEEDDISWALIEAALSSVAQTTVITMQDVLGLGNSARMNIPATEVGNWSWRIPSSMSFDCLETEALKLRDLLCMYGRI
ncbi:Glycoside hydrolase, family 77 [Corchorus olitorius]|uniref:4-alpha-glucanotransferase n=1 Tax=Corchorus olitorius TaxID=93759 RepID=A0A1R3K621_9ROSI|nr:Glycoside hydrolase, family 77 [Corchorus olitorius]